MKSLLCHGLLTFVGLFIVTTVHAEVIYREIFGRPAEVLDLSTVLFDWADFSSNGHWVPNVGAGMNPTDPNNTTVNFGINGSNDGRPIDVANVNAGPNSTGTFEALPRGIHFFLAAGGQPSLSWTPEYAVNPADYTGLSFSWYAGNANAADSQRLAVRVGTQWYANATSFTTPATTLAQFTTNAVLNTVPYNPSAANWLTLNFDGDYNTETDIGTDSTVPLSLGAVPGADLSGIITGFGIYIEGNAGTRRFDTFQIDGAPISSGLDGDFNSDNLVDAADYVVWRKGVAVPSTPENYTLWRSNFGNTASGPAVAGIPEPITLVLVLMAAVFLGSPRRSLIACRTAK